MHSVIGLPTHSAEEPEIQRAMAELAVLQVVQAEPKNQNLPCHFLQRCVDPGLVSSMRVPLGRQSQF